MQSEKGLLLFIGQKGWAARQNCVSGGRRKTQNENVTIFIEKS